MNLNEVQILGHDKNGKSREILYFSFAFNDGVVGCMQKFSFTFETKEEIAENNKKAINGAIAKLKKVNVYTDEIEAIIGRLLNININ